MGKIWKENRLFRLLIITGAVYFFLKFIVPLSAPFLLAMLFVTIFGSLLLKMQNRLKIHRQIGAILLLIIACVTVGVLAWLFFSWIVGSLPGWISILESFESEIGAVIHRICETGGRVFHFDAEYLEETLFNAIREGVSYFRLQLIPGMLSHSLEYVRIAGKFGAFLVSFLIATVLLAKDYDRIMNGMLDREEYHMVLEVICGIIRYLATFVKAQLIIMSVVGITAAAVLGISGIKNGVLWGLLAGFLDALPFIGTGIVLVPLSLYQLLTGHIARAVVCVVLYVICIVLREFLEPKLIGKKIGVSPIAILLAIYAGVKLFGGWGLIEGPLGFMIIYLFNLSLERRRADEESQQAEGERRREDEESQQPERERRREDEESQQAEGERRRADEESQQPEGERRRADEESQQAEGEKRREDEERQQPEGERRREDKESQQAEG